MKCYFLNGCTYFSLGQIVSKLDYEHLCIVEKYKLFQLD